MLKYWLNPTINDEIYTGEYKQPGKSYYAEVSVEQYLNDIKRIAEENGKKPFKFRGKKRQENILPFTGIVEVQPIIKNPNKFHRKARRLLGYTAEDIRIIAAAAIVKYEDKANSMTDEEYSEYINETLLKADKIINQYDEYDNRTTDNRNFGTGF